MPDILDERSFLLAAADEIEDYLLSGAANWQLAGPNSFPPLTPGVMLLTMKRLAGLNISDIEDGQIQNAIVQIEKVRLRWNSAWQKRIHQEIPLRLRLWSNYIDGLIETSDRIHPEYSWCVRWRVILALIMGKNEEQGGEDQQKMKILDESEGNHSPRFVRLG